MDSHDGIMTLLGIPDPVEKGLALKSKAVEPYHLRHALQDADSHIRAQAAGHPNLTRELMREILSGDDKDLKHIVLKRHDIDESELKLVATDPDHALEVARHPKTTDTIRQLALDYKHLPEGVKNEHSKRLSKSIGHITFPLLGEGKVYSNPMHLKDKEAAKTRDRYVTNSQTPDAFEGMMVANTADREAAPPHLRQVSGVAISQNKPASKETSKRVAATMEHADPMSVYNAASKIDSGKAYKATEDHEAQHGVFWRIAQKHGNEAMQRVLATTLSKLPEEHRQHMQSLYNAVGVHQHFLKDKDGKPLDGKEGRAEEINHAAAVIDPEEGITYLHNYLQDPHRRKQMHTRMGLHTAPEQQESMRVARRTWDKLRRIGMSLRPEDVGINPKDETDRMARWVKTLSKRESIPSDQLGFSVSFHELIAIAQFLTSQVIDLSVVRQALMTNGGDPRDAVLTAYGLNTPEGQKAFDNVKQLKLHKTEDVLKAPKSIVGIDDPDFANVLKEAYKSNKIESIALGGKHSSGSYIARDEKGNNWLLKPGSGQRSPAAGVDETKGSQSRREACFSALAELLGIEEVKAAHLLQIDGKEVAAIEMWPMDWTNLHRTMYEDANIPQRALDRYLRNGKIFRWSVLDAIAGNGDRHGNNAMVSSAEDGNKIGLIDHGSAFAGPSFDPGHDKDSFIPYYLRAWAGPGFHGMDHEEQLDQMPKLSGEADEELAEWIEKLNEKEIESVMHRYGMDPTWVLARLNKIKMLVLETGSASVATNKFWLAEPLSEQP